ncbi:hypothetical protein DAPPUDRAFT_265274 [Daphnia pulex]|uniref:BTB domain-containing protein n=1 Tax=Daphnia pulex TaxID=6669 RepID=E9HT63_DAPPU|nr:hypothetical protein DAPPUDRAFT_265274 [Daphnia pulex]|eukprot:EFX65069.1 hypothetical protein DAPPUDRAFT_265274 [Daphnia pulex]
MFATNLTEKASNEGSIEDVEFGVLHQLLHYLYTGRVIAATMEAIGAGLYIATDNNTR